MKTLREVMQEKQEELDRLGAEILKLHEPARTKQLLKMHHDICEILNIHGVPLVIDEYVFADDVGGRYFYEGLHAPCIRLNIDLLRELVTEGEVHDEYGYYAENFNTCACLVIIHELTHHFIFGHGEDFEKAVTENIKKCISYVRLYGEI